MSSIRLSLMPPRCSVLPCIGSLIHTAASPASRVARINRGSRSATRAAPKRPISISRPGRLSGSSISHRRSSSSGSTSGPTLIPIGLAIPRKNSTCAPCRCRVRSPSHKRVARNRPPAPVVVAPGQRLLIGQQQRFVAGVNRRRADQSGGVERLLVCAQHSRRIGRPAGGIERRPVDDVAAIGGQRHAAARFHVRRARLGELAGDPCDLDHRDTQPLGDPRAHRFEQGDCRADARRVAFAEGFGAVAALEDERLARRGLGRSRRLVARCPRSTQSPLPRQAAAQPPRAPPDRGKRASARREASANWRDSTRALVSTRPSLRLSPSCPRRWLPAPNMLACGERGASRRGWTT